MKTNKQNRSQKQNSGRTDSVSGLPIRPEQSSAETAKADAAASPIASPSPAQATPLTRPYINFEARERNRQLPLDRVLAILKRWNPRQFELAEVIGNWIWITFPEQPDERTRADLSQLGFHWNNTRKCWQHPCGHVTTRGQQDPRLKYGSRMARAAATAAPQPA